MKCETSILEDRSCYEVLKEVNITGREGSLFGADNRYVRLSLVRSEDDFDLLLRQINKLVSVEINDKHVATTSTILRQSNETTLLLTAGVNVVNRTLDLRMELETLNSNIFPRQNGLYTTIDLSFN